MNNTKQSENLLISNCTMFLIMLAYLVSMSFMIHSLNKAKSDIKGIKLSKNEVASSNLNYLNLSKGSTTPKQIKIRRDQNSGIDPETGIKSF